MLRFSTGKIIATIGFIVIGLLLAVPSLFSPQQRQGFVQSIPSWVPGWIGVAVSSIAPALAAP